MTHEEILARADVLRNEAKQALYRLQKLPNDVSCGLSDRFVDCIIGAAILEITALQATAFQAANQNKDA